MCVTSLSVDTVDLQGLGKPDLLHLELWHAAAISVLTHKRSQVRSLAPTEVLCAMCLVSPDRLHGSHIMQYRYGYYKSGVPLRVLLVYFAASACAAASQPFVTIASEYPQRCCDLQ